eukprot:SAG31_NODE_32016_length_361_cov_0.725191_1_plen_103_part_00
MDTRYSSLEAGRGKRLLKKTTKTKQKQTNKPKLFQAISNLNFDLPRLATAVDLGTKFRLVQLSTEFSSLTNNQTIRHLSRVPSPRNREARPHQVHACAALQP